MPPKSYRYNAASNRFSSRFSTSLTNALRLLSQTKASTHSPSPTGSHTAAHTAKQGPSLPRPQCGFALPAKSLQSTTFATLDSAVLLYTYISRFSVAPPLSATALSQTIFHRVFQLLAQTAHVCFHRQKRVHTRLSEKDRTQGHTRRNRWRFGWGWYHYPRSVSHGSETLRGRVSERQTLPLLGLARRRS